MPYPTGTPVIEQALAALKTRLESIAPPSYANNVRRVERYSPLNTELVREFPAIIIGAPVTQVAQTVAGIVSNDADVILRAVAADRTTHISTLNTLEADIRASLYSDIQLGGVICWLRITSVDQYEMLAEMGPLAAVDITVRIHYRHRIDDPNTAA